MAKRKRKARRYGSPPEEHRRDAGMYGRHAQGMMRLARRSAAAGRCQQAISQLAEAAIATGKMAANRRGSGSARIYMGAERAVAKLSHALAVTCVKARVK